MIEYLLPFAYGLLCGLIPGVLYERKVNRARSIVKWLYCGVELDSPGWWKEMRKRTKAFDGKNSV